MTKRTAWSTARRARTLAALLVAGATALGAAAPATSTVDAEAGAAATAWLDGDAGRAARELEGRLDRASALNRGVALVYAGDAATAERELAALRAREPKWTPALRWLARAQAASGSPQRETTLKALLAAADADSRDFLWTGRLQHDAGRPDAAAASFRAAVTQEAGRDSTQARRAAVYEMDRATGECVVRQVVEGLYGYDRFPLSPLDQDGVSILLLARGMAEAPSSLSVLTAVDSTWKGTQLRSVGNERIRWAGREVEAVEVEALGHYKGPAGLSGRVRTWISRDGRATLYRASVKLALGSVVLELQPDFEQAARLEPE
jgi:hypothetical protein